MNIYQRLNEVRKRVEYVQKDKDVGGKYMAVTHDAVTALIREHLIEHGVMIVPSLVSSRVVETKMTTGKGVPYIRYEATYKLDFVNCDEGDSASVLIESHAIDEGDKAPGKALSYATKYAILKLFSIETGEDEEARPQVKVAREPAKDEADVVARQILDANIAPTADAMESLPPEARVAIRKEAKAIETAFHTQTVQGAYEMYMLAKESMDDTEQVALWSCMDSKTRSGIKKYGNSLKEAA